jgi:hypothetical protein
MDYIQFGVYVGILQDWSASSIEQACLYYLILLINIEKYI